MRLLARAQRSRTQSETDANAHSSRSHAIFTIKIVKVPLIDDRVYEVRPSRSRPRPRRAPCCLTRLVPYCRLR